MARSLQATGKRLMISKANTTIVVAVSIAAAVTTFSLIATRSLLSRRSYQSKVISVQEKARDQLKENIEAVSSLKESYAAFVSQPENVIGGSSTGTGERDGDNAQIILDALPSKYDFPALASSLEKILVDRGYSIQAITGTDDEVNQNTSADSEHHDAAATTQGTASTTSTTTQTATQPAPQVGSGIEMPYGIKAAGTYDNMITVLDVFSRSIRVLGINTMTLEAQTDSLILLSIDGKSFYQPAKALNIKEEVVQ